MRPTKPTKEQLAFLKSAGFKVPPRTEEEASTIIASIVDSHKRHNTPPPPGVPRGSGPEQSRNVPSESAEPTKEQLAFRVVRMGPNRRLWVASGILVLAVIVMATAFFFPFIHTVIGEVFPRVEVFGSYRLGRALSLAAALTIFAVIVGFVLPKHRVGLVALAVILACVETFLGYKVATSGCMWIGSGDERGMLTVPGGMSPQNTAFFRDEVFSERNIARVLQTRGLARHFSVHEVKANLAIEPLARPCPEGPKHYQEKAVILACRAL